MYCPNCGTRLEENAITCTSCMAQVNIFNENIKKWENYIRTSNVNKQNEEIKDENKVSKKNIGFNPTLAIPAIIVYTIFMYLMIFGFMGYDFSLSEDPYDFFINELEISGFKAEGNVYSETTYDSESGQNITISFDLDNNLFSLTTTDTYTYDYKNDIFILSFNEGTYVVDASYSYSDGTYDCSITPSRWNSLCSKYKDSVIESSVTVKKYYDTFMESLKVNTEDIIKEDK